MPLQISQNSALKSLIPLTVGSFSGAELSKSGVLGQFLGFLARDIANHPERLQAVDPGLVQRLQSLVGGIEVDLDSTLSADDE